MGKGETVREGVTNHLSQEQSVRSKKTHRNIMAVEKRILVIGPLPDGRGSVGVSISGVVVPFDLAYFRIGISFSTNPSDRERTEHNPHRHVVGAAEHLHGHDAVVRQSR